VVPPITTIEVGPEGEDVGLSKALEERGHKIGLFDINIGVSESESSRVGSGRVERVGMGEPGSGSESGSGDEGTEMMKREETKH
jgi:hypothetical protein